MTLEQLEKRVERLEKLMSEQPLSAPRRNAKWWLDNAGVFANDPGYDQIVRFGRKYRQSLKPPIENISLSRKAGCLANIKPGMRRSRRGPEVAIYIPEPA